jgi:hypothetical protein
MTRQTELATFSLRGRTTPSCWLSTSANPHTPTRTTFRFPHQTPIFRTTTGTVRTRARARSLLRRCWSAMPGSVVVLAGRSCRSAERRWTQPMRSAGARVPRGTLHSYGGFSMVLYPQERHIVGVRAYRDLAQPASETDKGAALDENGTVAAGFDRFAVSVFNARNGQLNLRP